MVWFPSALMCSSQGPWGGWWWEKVLVFKEEEAGEHASIRVLLEARGEQWGPHFREFSGPGWTWRTISAASMHRTSMNTHRALLCAEQETWALCVSRQPRKLCQALSLLYQLYVFSSLPLLSVTGAPIKGKNPLEVCESWHCVLPWICWHCCGLLCKHTSVDFVQHKLCKYPFRDSSKCRLLAWCLETIIKISDVNLYLGLMCELGQPVDV